MKVLIVDDEELSLQKLRRLLKNEGIEDVTSFDNPIEALKKAKSTKFDIVFLDISMPEMSGLELANNILELEPATFIIFQTAFSEYSLQGFQSGGIDYLLKPITKENIKKALEKIYNLLPEKKSKPKILAKNLNTLYLIDINDIYYIQADLDEVIIKIKDNIAYTRRKISELESFLKSHNFFRIHRSYIVNVDKIKSMKTVEQSKLQISFDDIEEVITSSKDGAKEFREYIERRSL
ncbi:MAG: Two-component system response regulator, LytR/AlgR family [uncultured Campylobacterales bacterium]|uniref:Two-component system response regulator, LytR/AlgR family n=1 Tax=uncultured Campylobacterales bacterium TaxID=352960 RepID=A0A6S6T004_9BACT|nr:MAG: Two-component system response regulator, LytR/AlgR family [uncultured Campylobacterales bacterium]